MEAWVSVALVLFAVELERKCEILKLERYLSRGNKVVWQEQSWSRC